MTAAAAEAAEPELKVGRALQRYRLTQIPVGVELCFSIKPTTTGRHRLRVWFAQVKNGTEVKHDIEDAVGSLQDVTLALAVFAQGNLALAVGRAQDAGAGKSM